MELPMNASGNDAAKILHHNEATIVVISAPGNPVLKKFWMQAGIPRTVESVLDVSNKSTYTSSTRALETFRNGAYQRFKGPAEVPPDGPPEALSGSPPSKTKDGVRFVFR